MLVDDTMRPRAAFPFLSDPWMEAAVGLAQEMLPVQPGLDLVLAVSVGPETAYLSRWEDGRLAEMTRSSAPDAALTVRCSVDIDAARWFDANPGSAAAAGVRISTNVGGCDVDIPFPPLHLFAGAMRVALPVIRGADVSVQMRMRDCAFGTVDGFVVFVSGQVAACGWGELADADVRVDGDWAAIDNFVAGGFDLGDVLEVLDVEGGLDALSVVHGLVRSDEMLAASARCRGVGTAFARLARIRGSVQYGDFSSALEVMTVAPLVAYGPGDGRRRKGRA